MALAGCEPGLDVVANVLAMHCDKDELDGNEEVLQSRSLPLVAALIDDYRKWSKIESQPKTFSLVDQTLSSASFLKRLATPPFPPLTTKKR